MRLSRMFFCMPFACLALAAALTFFTPQTQRRGDDVGAAAVSWQAPTFSLFDVTMPADAILAERTLLDSPVDAHASVYVRANQPLTTWRLAADAYSRIDPHIRVG